VKVPVAADGAAPKRRLAVAPGETLKGLAGFEVTPVGRPATVIWTDPEKLFKEVTDKATCELVFP
jgi:hypothetical protein